MTDTQWITQMVSVLRTLRDEMLQNGLNETPVTKQQVELWLSQAPPQGPA
jgi:hypothetical protein